MISESAMVRPINRFNEPIVFLKFDVSCDFADSPRVRCLGPNATNDLDKIDRFYSVDVH